MLTFEPEENDEEFSAAWDIVDGFIDPPRDGFCFYYAQTYELLPTLKNAERLFWLRALT